MSIPQQTHEPDDVSEPIMRKARVNLSSGQPDSTQGIGVVQVMLLGLLVSGLMAFLGGMVLNTRKNSQAIQVRTVIVNDRKMILYDLSNRRLPTENP